MNHDDQPGLSFHVRNERPGDGRPSPVQMGCQTCGHVLNRHLDQDTGVLTYLHPAQHPGGHEPSPVPAEQIAAGLRQVCDLCSDPNPVYAYRTGAITAVLLTERGQAVHDYGGAWSACIVCAGHLDDHDLDALHARCVRSAPVADPDALAAMRALQYHVINGLLPGRTLLTGGHWPPAPLRPASLPRVRDRLTGLLRGPDGLPGTLDTPAIRSQIADGLDRATLFWLDDQFTGLTHHAAATLPTGTVHPHDLPDPYGLLGWAEPVGDGIVAASWASTGDGVQILTYRAVGDGLDPEPLQRLRAGVGWLLPAHHLALQPATTVIGATHPAAPLVTAWLLIKQRLADATATGPVDKGISRAYRRAGLPAPQVRLVRLRPATAPTPGPGRDDQQAGTPPAQRSHTYRWWVRGHWRNQPYGPGRTSRRLIFIDPQLRGPADQPINPTTTVRVLSTPTPPSGGPTGTADRRR